MNTQKNQDMSKTLDMFNTEIRLCDSVAVVNKGIIGEVWDIPNPESVKVRVLFRVSKNNGIVELQAENGNVFELVSADEVVTRNTRPFYNVIFRSKTDKNSEIEKIISVSDETFKRLNGCD